MSPAERAVGAWGQVKARMLWEAGSVSPLGWPSTTFHSTNIFKFKGENDVVHSLLLQQDLRPRCGRYCTNRRWPLSQRASSQERQGRKVVAEKVSLCPEWSLVS